MTDKPPRVSIGLPVYNGENFVAQAIESVLAQSFADWELIVSDNASDDRTAEICQRYAAADSRIRYFRSAYNEGVGWNFDRTAELARGEYFKWLAHDDVIAREQLTRLVRVLDERPDVVLVACQSAVIDADGELIAPAADTSPTDESLGVPAWREERRRLDTAAEGPVRRFAGVLLHSVRCYEVFGLMRTAVLRQTRLHGRYRGSEKVLLAELALRGKFFEVPEVLFFSRWHSGRYSANLSARDQQQHFNPREGRRFVWPFQLRCSWEYFRTIWRPPVSLWQRLLCCTVLLRFALQLRKWPTIVRRLFTGSGDTVHAPADARRLGRHPNFPTSDAGTRIRTGTALEQVEECAS